MLRKLFVFCGKFIFICWLLNKWDKIRSDNNIFLPIVQTVASDRISKTRDTDETSSGRQAKFFSGDDASFLAALAVGGAGVISVLSNIFPKAYVDLYNAFQSGNHNLAVRYHEAVLEFVEALFSEPNSCPTKAVLAELGLCQEYFRLPLVAVDSLSRARIIECYHQATKELDTIKAAHNNEQ